MPERKISSRSHSQSIAPVVRSKLNHKWPCALHQDKFWNDYLFQLPTSLFPEGCCSNSKSGTGRHESPSLSCATTELLLSLSLYRFAHTAMPPSLSLSQEGFAARHKSAPGSACSLCLFAFSLLEKLQGLRSQHSTKTLEHGGPPSPPLIADVEMCMFTWICAK